jgi:hypothetical protein
MTAMWALWVTVALAGNPGNRWEGVPGDVEVTASSALTPEQVTEAFADVDRVRRTFPDTCAFDWTKDEFGEPQAIWTPSWVRRRLSVKVDEVKPGRRVSWDWHGKRDTKGFWLVVDVTPRDGGSTVKVSTPLDPPGWPVRGVFYRKIRPVWAACYATALQALDPKAEVTEMTRAVEPQGR